MAKLHSELAARTVGRFRLSRFFSLVSLAGIAVVITILAFSYRYIAFGALEQEMIRNNVSLATALAAKVWPRYKTFFTQAPSLSRSELALRPEITSLRVDILRETSGLPVVKVKIYSLDGLTLFSTDSRQIGELKSNSAGIRHAARGEVSNEIVFQNDFYNLEQIVADRNLLTSYVPIRTGTDVRVQGVFELYSDITPLVDALKYSERRVLGSVVFILALLYLFLLLLARHADRILAAREVERAEQESRIRHQAYHDALTGLPNRTSFTEHLETVIKRAKRGKRLVGVLLLDVDRFKLVNDSLGHDAGDELLQRLVHRIASCARESDMTFRIGGDEFTIILEDLESTEMAGVIAKRILGALADPLVIGERDTIMTASIGIAIYPKDATTPEMLVKGADAAMYRAKEAGRNCFEFYTHEMNSTAMQRLSLQTDLQRALKENRFFLHYQPRASLISGAITGVEALLRWNRQNDEMLLPASFLPYLEDSGLIVSVGDWVLHEACRQYRAWLDAGLSPIRISVNISPRQFRSGALVQTVKTALRDSGLDPHNLELELTESLLVEGTNSAIEILNELKTIGVSISIDDFGSGYSSLNYLKRFPVDILKIDRSFICDIAETNKDAAIVATIVALARNLGMGVVAEGVETQSQVEILRSNGCHEVQGLLLSGPVPPDDIPALLTSSGSDRAPVLVAGAHR